MEVRVLPERVSRLAMVARWKPVHRGHSAALRALTAYADHVLIGIGSSNRYDASNPFTAAESRAMLELALEGRANYEVLEFPDLGDGPRWSAMVSQRLGELDLFVTANGYVRSLLLERYAVLHPVHLVPEEERVALDATTVRRAMAQGEEWTAMVDPAVERYLREHGLVNRFRREFGAAYA